VQDVPGFFLDRTAALGVAPPSRRSTGFGTAAHDFDLDGQLDFALANGRVSRRRDVSSTSALWTGYEERNQLFLGRGRGRFEDRTDAEDGLCGTPAVARGLACADFDDDGDLDLLVTAIDGPARLLENRAARRGHWFTVRALVGRRDALGAEVIVEAAGRLRKGWVQSAYSYLCASDPRAHFGLGDASRVDRVRVLWPDGSEGTFGPFEVDRSVTLRQEGK
jgi:hypothetical protein